MNAIQAIQYVLRGDVSFFCVSSAWQCRLRCKLQPFMALNGPLYADLLLRNGSLTRTLYTPLAVSAERYVSEKIAMWKQDIKRKQHVLYRDWILSWTISHWMKLSTWLRIGYSGGCWLWVLLCTRSCTNQKYWRWWWLDWIITNFCYYCWGTFTRYSLLLCVVRLDLHGNGDNGNTAVTADLPR